MIDQAFKLWLQPIEYHSINCRVDRWSDIIPASVRIVSRRFLLAQEPFFVLDGYLCLEYNMLNKRAVCQRTPDRRKVSVQKVAPYITRAGELLFAFYVDNKSYYCAKHNYKCEQVTVCNHKHQPPFFRPAADITPQRLPWQAYYIVMVQPRPKVAQAQD